MGVGGVYEMVKDLVATLKVPLDAKKLESLLPPMDNTIDENTPPEKGMARLEPFVASVAKDTGIPITYSSKSQILSITLDRNIANTLLDAHSEWDRTKAKSNLGVLTGKAGMTEREKTVLNSFLQAHIVPAVRSGKLSDGLTSIFIKDPVERDHMPFNEGLLESTLPVLFTRLISLLKDRRLLPSDETINIEFPSGSLLSDYMSDDLKTIDRVGSLICTRLATNEEKEKQSIKPKKLTKIIKIKNIEKGKNKTDPENSEFARMMDTCPDMKVAARRALKELIDTWQEIKNSPAPTPTAGEGESAKPINRTQVAANKFIAQIETAYIEEIISSMRHKE